MKLKAICGLVKVYNGKHVTQGCVFQHGAKIELHLRDPSHLRA